MLRKYTAALDCDLTEKEILAYGRELAQINQEIAAEEDRQNGLKQELKARIGGLEARRTEVSAKVNQGKEVREVQIEVLADFKRGAATEIRTDTGEVYRERPLRDDEKQPGLFRGEEFVSEQIVTVNAAPHSVEISRNASGGVAFTAKAYAETLERAIQEAKAAYFRLNEEFPVQPKEKK